MDVLTPKQRRKCMQHIRSKDTSIELALRKALWHRGYRYRKNFKKLPGSPDIAITRHKVAIFCDGEFFHGKDWEVKKPQLLRGNNPDFWVKKIERNKARDLENDRQLLFLGWTVIRFWGGEIKKDLDTCVKVVEEAIWENTLAETEETAALRWGAFEDPPSETVMSGDVGPAPDAAAVTPSWAVMSGEVAPATDAAAVIPS